jgi:hypothetical protein
MNTRSASIFDKDDLRRAAHSMIGAHGARAGAVAAERASHLVGDDVVEARQMWERIARAIQSLEHAAPRNAMMH